MFKGIVPVPFNDYPIELLTPASRDGKAVWTGRAEGRNSRRSKKVTLQVPIRSQLLQVIGHRYNLMMTVRSAPGFVAPTMTTSKVSLAPIIIGDRAKPDTELEIVLPSVIVSEQYK